MQWREGATPSFRTSDQRPAAATVNACGNTHPHRMLGMACVPAWHIPSATETHVPVSSWFCTPSLHDGTAQVCVAVLQTPDSQSSWASQAVPAAHLVAQLPPQSTADSSPLMTPSSHDAAAHRPSLHTRELQSAGPPHPLPTPQPAQLPPQSTSVSSPFAAPSSHVGATQAPPLHTSERQSVPE